MSIRSKLWGIIAQSYPLILRKIYKMDIGKDVIISYKAHLDKSINPKGVHIGDYTWVLAGSYILAHDHCRGILKDTFIGHNCVIGINSIIMPGVNIGNHVVVGGGSIVTKDIPDNCIVAGNPATILKEGVQVSNKGQILTVVG